MERTQISATKKIKNRNFYKNKKVTKINDIDFNKILVSKEEPYGIKLRINLNTLLDTMIKMLLDHYVQGFRK